MNAHDLDTRLAAAVDIVRAAGRLALDYFRRRDALEIEHKGRQDLVSVADRAVEDLIRRELGRHFPEDGILGEEGGLEDDGGTSRFWVLDPIDGTFNYAAGSPATCPVAAGSTAASGFEQYLSPKKISASSNSPSSSQGNQLRPPPSGSSGAE